MRSSSTPVSPSVVDISADGIGQPEIVIRDARAHAASDGRMPPVLHVAFAELMGGRAEELFAERRGIGMDQRHRILKLIAETEAPPD